MVDRKFAKSIEYLLNDGYATIITDMPIMDEFNDYYDNYSEEKYGHYGDAWYRFGLLIDLDKSNEKITVQWNKTPNFEKIIGTIKGGIDAKTNGAKILVYKVSEIENGLMVKYVSV